MEYGQLLLSKVIDANDPAAFTRFSIDEHHFATKGERETYRFIVDYAEQNRGQAPSYATVTAECADFTYIPQVADSYEFLTRKIKSYAAKLALMEYVQGDFTRDFNGSDDGNSLLDGLISAAERIKIRTDVRKGDVGRTLTEIKESFKDEYQKRVEGKSAKRWDTPFPLLTKAISGWFSGDVYGIMAESGRGKTYVNVKIVDSLLRQGANVLVKSFEVKEYVWIARLISVATATDEMFLDELGRAVGIPNKQILSGNLDEIVQEHLFAILAILDTYYKGTLYFQGKSGAELTRTLNDLERELMTGKIDAVFLDPFYGLTDVYGNNANKTAGGAAEQAATRFENIIGDNDVVGFYTVQATVEKKKLDENDARELNLPTRDQVKTSKRLLDIATNLISFDSLEKEGRAMLGIEKGRNGGEDFTLELLALLDYGVLREMTTGEAVAAQFTGVF